MPRAELRTARLFLRPVAPQDAPGVLAGLNDLAVSGWLSVVPYPYTQADFDQFQRDMAHPGGTFALEDSSGFVGILGLEKASLGYWLLPRAQGKGYATEAARAALGLHFAQGGGPVRSGYFEGNERSAHVLAKLGFIETGRRLNHCRPLGRDRPHVDLILTATAYDAALPWAATSPRLTYRVLQYSDAARLRAILTLPAVARQIGPLRFETEPDLRVGEGSSMSSFCWGIFLAGQLIGTVNITKGELGYLIAPPFWGKGYATEACQTALDRARADGQTRFTSLVWADNPASLRVLAKLGFREGEARLSTSAARPDPARCLSFLWP